MSGLLKFLGQHLSPSIKQDGPMTYQKSLADIQYSNNSDEDDGTMNDENTPGGNNNNNDKKWITYRDWRKQQARSLTEYMFARLMDPGGDDDKEDDRAPETKKEDSKEEEGDDDDEDSFSNRPETQQFETQQPLDEDLPFDTEPPSPEQKASRHKIPHVSLTQHTASTISDIDLYTKELNLSLCRIEKVYPLRNVKRCERETKAQVFDCKLNSLLPLKPFSAGFQDDGPMASAYKTVLSVHLTQLHHAHLPQTSAKQIMVFFYDDYAQAMDRFLRQNGMINHVPIHQYLRLVKVPGKCIFPYTEVVPSFAAQRTPPIPYCICLGSESQLGLLFPIESNSSSSSNHDNRKSKVDLRCGGVSILSITKDEEAIEAVLSSSNKNVLFEELLQDSDDDSDVVSNRGPLQQCLSAWKSSHVQRIAPAQRQEQVPTPQQQPQDEASTEQESQRRKRERENKRESSAPPPQRSRTTDGMYDKLGDLRNIYDTFRSAELEARSSPFPSVNIVAVLVAFGQPFRCKNNTWMISLTLTDRSLATNEGQASQFVVNVFRKDITELPKPSRAGELVRMKGAGIQEYNGDLQLLGRKNTKMNLISKSSLDEDLLRFDPPDPNVSSDELDHFHDIWNWGHLRLVSQPSIKQECRFTLSELSSLTEAGDVTVLVSGLYPTPQIQNRQLPCGILRAWDGTGISTCDAFPFQNLLTQSARKEPPDDALVSIYLAIEALNDTRQADSLELNDVHAVCGRVINVAVWEPQHWEFCRQRLRIGGFVRLRNVKPDPFEPGSTLSCLTVHVKSSLIPVPEDCFEVRHLLEDHQARVSRNENINPQSGVLPLTMQSAPSATLQPPQDDQQENYETLEAVSLASNGDVLACRFKVTTLLPDFTGGDLSPYCDGSEYLFVAMIADDQGTEVEAFVVDTPGAVLFGMPASEASKLKDAEAKAMIDRMCNSAPQAWWTGSIVCREQDGKLYPIIQSMEKLLE